MMSLTPVVRLLLVSNVIFFLFDRLSEGFLIDNFALYSFSSPAFRPYQFLTYMFLHANIFHIFSNMFGLFIFGSLLERVLGSQKFMILYIVSGLGAGVLYSGIRHVQNENIRQQALVTLENPSPMELRNFIYDNYSDLGKDPQIIKFMEEYDDNPQSEEHIILARTLIQKFGIEQQSLPMVGASGAIFGLLAAFGLLFPNMMLMLLFPPIPMKAKYFIGLYALFEIYALYANDQRDNVAHLAHLIGMVFGFIFIKLVWRMRKIN